MPRADATSLQTDGTSLGLGLENGVGFRIEMAMGRVAEEVENDLDMPSLHSEDPASVGHARGCTRLDMPEHGAEKWGLSVQVVSRPGGRLLRACGCGVRPGTRKCRCVKQLFFTVELNLNCRQTR
jgi:hypothetical protein